MKTRLKTAIKNLLQLSPTKELDIERVKLIREVPLESLRDQAAMSDLLCKLGLNDEELFNFPEFLYPYCGNGLHSWQYPVQLSRYLIKLSEYKISSYLEIGAKHGGTFIITTEYLQRFNKLKSATAVDLFPIKGVNRYKKLNPAVTSLAVNSQSKQFMHFVENNGPFDLAFIDGDHSYEGCLSDFRTMKDHARMLVFHDIVGMGVPGVIKVWEEIKTQHADEFDFFEFVEQYDEVVQKTGKTWLGIGLAVKKK